MALGLSKASSNPLSWSEVVWVDAVLSGLTEVHPYPLPPPLFPGGHVVAMPCAAGISLRPSQGAAFTSRGRARGWLGLFGSGLDPLSLFAAAASKPISEDEDIIWIL